MNVIIGLIILAVFIAVPLKVTAHLFKAGNPGVLAVSLAIILGNYFEDLVIYSIPNVYVAIIVAVVGIVLIYSFILKVTIPRGILIYFISISISLIVLLMGIGLLKLFGTNNFVMRMEDGFDHIEKFSKLIVPFKSLSSSS